MTTEYEPIEVRQTRGPVIAFQGTLLAETEWETGKGDKLSLELWETPNGAWVAVSEMEPKHGGFADIRGTVVPPGGDEIARQCAVLNHFEWNNRARAMLRKALGWAPKVEVD